MNFKKPQEDVVNKVYYRVDNILRNSMHEMLMHNGYGQHYMGPNMGPNMEAMMYAITMAITEATRTIIENTYTDCQFEEDLNLRDKK